MATSAFHRRPGSSAIQQRPATPFRWTTFDVTHLMPADWDAAIVKLARSVARPWTIVPTSVTSRERDRAARLPTLTVGGSTVREQLPWLATLYDTAFRDLAQSCVAEPVCCAQDHRYGVVLNVKHGTAMRYECHVDSNPLEGLLYVTTHAAGSGGELVVSNRGDVSGYEEVDADCSTIYPVRGHLVFFEGSHRSHYVRPLADKTAVRVVAAMNYYTPSLPETARPPDLNLHLFGED
jgi:hypothetical protein